MAEPPLSFGSFQPGEPLHPGNQEEFGAVYDDDDAGAFASSIWNQNTHGDMVRNLSTSTYYPMSDTAQPSAHHSPLQAYAMNGYTPHGAGQISTPGSEQPDGRQMLADREWPLDAFEYPSFRFDPALVDSSSANGGVDTVLANIAQFPVSPNITPRWQHLTTQQGSQGPWSPLHVNHGNEQSNPMPDYWSGDSSTGRPSSQGVLSSASITRATWTSATSEYYDDTVLAESGLTERLPMSSPGLSPGTGNNTLLPMAQADRHHLARRPNST